MNFRICAKDCSSLPEMAKGTAFLWKNSWNRLTTMIGLFVWTTQKKKKEKVAEI
jgi:hypothetical protein